MKTEITGQIHVNSAMKTCAYCKHFQNFYEIEEENKHLKIIAWIESPGVCKLLTPVNRGVEVCYSGETFKIPEYPTVFGYETCSNHKLDKKLIKYFLNKAYLKEF